MKSRVAVVGMIALALSGVESSEAHQKRICEATFDNMDISPGFWREGNSGTFTTNGEAGSRVVCNGR